MDNIMSSPDPLNASLQDSALMSSRRVTRSQSQASSRLSSVNPSPRKQTFALDVGNERSPQKILVTVEADDRDSHSSNVKRKLFQSPTPKRAVRRREKTTTTVVPLKGLTDDEGGEPSSSVAPTPKRRGRPPKSAGTPATTTKKKATPIRKTPGRPRRTKTEDLTSDITIPDPDATPKPTRTRTSTKRKNATPAEDAGETPKPKRRGRPRRMSMAAEEIMVLAAQSETASGVEDDASVASAGDNISVAGSYASAPPSSHGGDDDDIWMATLSDPPTQQLSRRESPVEEERTDGGEQDQARLPSVDRQTETDDRSESNVEYGATGGYSEAESVGSHSRGNSVDKDTIMVQEDFTMISIHSLPSMQGNLSVAASQHEIGDETSLIISQTLESLRHSRNESRPKTPYEDQVSFVGPSPEKDNLPLPTNNSLFAQSASSPVIKPSPRRAKAQDLGRQLAFKSLQKQQDPESPQRLPVESEPEAHAAGEQSIYDDSFSEIPEAVLEAATPKPIRRAMAEVRDDSFSEISEAVLDAATPKPSRQVMVPDNEGAETSIQLSIERPSRVNPPNPQSESNRLLTPDETPSPVLSENEDDKVLESAMKEQSEFEMQSSPPVLNFPQREQLSAVRPSRRGSSETPALQVPSSRSPPRIQVDKADAQTLAPPESAARPTLSPIVRAGRALQMVTSDPPSPPARSPSLGSPFRASISKSPAPSMAATQPAPTSQPAPVTQSSPAAKPTPAATTAQRAPAPAPEEQQNSPWSSAFAPFKQIKNLVVQGAQVFSPRAVPVAAVEDPFVSSAANNATEERHDTLSLHNSMFSLGGGSMDHPSRTSSVQAEAAYEDEMSWQADETPAPQLHERLDSASSTMRARRGSEIGEMSDVDMESLAEESVIEQDDDDEEHEPANDFDDDIWAVEAQRPTPGRPQPKVTDRESVLNPPRRSKLPSPWRQNSKRLVYNDELHKLASDTADKEGEFSLLSQFGDKGPEVVAQTVNPPKKVDLSAFFSSPALLPEVLPPGVSYPKPAQRLLSREPQSRPSLASGVEIPAERPTQIGPQSQSRGTPSVARRIFSFGRRTGDTPSNLTAAPSVPSIPQKELQIGSQRRVDLFSPVKHAASEELEAVEHSSQPSTPRQLFPHVPQKRNFTPRSGQTENSLFTPSPASRQTASVEPDEVYSEDEETVSPEHHSSSPHQESSFIAPVLKPLPSRAQSPTKSCIRSPLKPKTPGRVVEFTSSTLSPLAQAQARAEQRASSASQASPDKPVASGMNKENQPTTSKPSFLLPNNIPHLPPPTTSLSNPAARLSPTTWTRPHWERLDALLQQRRRSGALAFQLAHPVAKTNSTRPKLLGKQVEAQGETMTLEQWHLDVVDAFAAEVGQGSVWDERVLAKRVFALLVGEERRRKGEIDRRARGEMGSV
ncbi:hypothetical protein CONLIGDRAFT_429376 [Coniochaeta ligniaria NRRL 30616]|uniref:Uncharacterized protein n=1 Tax=Coniochaeta ligniaria NRRL 30616 TaxID=1408157 RepID=A0A1J7JIH4_9PEZI|nr:hypothetical protein CONLIGDRAFT_429376 [Coniochaeta ligniaria NRRL 30616]